MTDLKVRKRGFILEISSPNNIYEIVLRDIRSLINSLDKEVSDEEIKNSQRDAQKRLDIVYKELNSSLDRLRLNAEWDVFCIAFYGETNAGKSTLIETLRILLKEPTKEKEREKFKKNYKSLCDVKNQAKQISQLINQVNNEYSSNISNIEESIEKNCIEILEIEMQISILNENSLDIKNRIQLKRRSSIFNFLLAIFRKLKEQNEYLEVKNKIDNYLSSINTLKSKNSDLMILIESYKSECVVKVNELRMSEHKLIKIESKHIEELKINCDGKIIGDGHSDFTRKVTTYQFDYNGQKFAMLDLPGIEGKEDLVIDEIKDAVQKAHAVFYISGKPTPPQTGSKQTEGTLEKIERHLGQQTEVYSIFNKRIKNYQQLQPGLINNDERESLAILDRIMTDRLGNQYGNHFILSSYPAFLSVANCVQSDFEKAQNKFFEKFATAEEILNETRVKDFCNWLTINLVKDCRSKIKKSNFKKVRVSLDKTHEEISLIYDNLYDLEEKLIKTKKSTDIQLDESAEILKQNLNNATSQALSEFKTLLRQNIYSDIDKEIDNSEFKISFETRKNEAMEILRSKIDAKYTLILNEFEAGISHTVEKYYRYVSELLSSYEDIAQFDVSFTAEIQIKDGANWGGAIASLVSGIVGIILCFTNPVGWVVIALSILATLISVGKEIVGFFNHKYRASQQKKSADDNIDKMGELIMAELRLNLNNIHDPLEAGIKKIKDDMFGSISYVKSMNAVFRSSKVKLKLLISDIDDEGAK